MKDETGIWLVGLIMVLWMFLMVPILYTLIDRFVFAGRLLSDPTSSDAAFFDISFIVLFLGVPMVIAVWLGKSLKS